jgi:hypothetical protein
VFHVEQEAAEAQGLASENDRFMLSSYHHRGDKQCLGHKA